MQPAKGSAVPPQHLADASGSRSPFLPSSCLRNPVAGAEPWVEHEAAAPAHREQLLTFYWGLKRFGNCHHHVGTENLRESRGVWGDHGCMGDRHTISGMKLQAVFPTSSTEKIQTGYPSSWGEGTRREAIGPAAPTRLHSAPLSQCDTTCERVQGVTVSRSPRLRVLTTSRLPASTGTRALTRQATFCPEVIYHYCTVSFKRWHFLENEL